MGRVNYLIEGVSGTGKTAVCAELRRRGFHAVNGDRELAYQGDPDTGEPRSDIAGLAMHDHHLWRVDLVESIVADRSRPVTFFCGGSRNVDRFFGLFDEVFVLTVDAETLARRLDGRPADEWGGQGRTDERALIEHLHRTGTDTPPGVAIDATVPLAQVVDDILARVSCDRESPRR